MSASSLASSSSAVSIARRRRYARSIARARRRMCRTRNVEQATVHRSFKSAWAISRPAGRRCEIRNDGGGSGAVARTAS
jgi:hypothetical protein